MASGRRHVLQATGSLLTVGLAGCFEPGLFRSGAHGFNPSDHVEDWHDEPVRGQAQSIEFEQQVEPGSLGRKCGWASADAVETAVKKRIERWSPQLDVSRTQSSALPDEGWFIEVAREIRIDNTGEVYKTPVARFQPLVEATPRTVSATVYTEDWQRSCEHAVYVFDTVIQAD